jgi:hypothetical protein
MRPRLDPAIHRALHSRRAAGSIAAGRSFGGIAVHRSGGRPLDSGPLADDVPHNARTPVIA